MLIKLAGESPDPMFRFTIRDVLWLTLLVAVCCAWWLHVRYAEIRQAVLTQEINRQLTPTLREANQELERIRSVHVSINAGGQEPSTDNDP